MTNHIGVVYSKNKTKLSSSIDRMRFLAKTKQDSDVTERTSVVYAKNGIKLSWLIRSSVLYEENQIGQ